MVEVCGGILESLVLLSVRVQIIWWVQSNTEEVCYASCFDCKGGGYLDFSEP